jgi:transposase
MGPARHHRGQAGDQGVEVRATTKGLVELADHLVANGIERTVLESTSDYWRPFFYILEGAGLEVWLVNARQAKNVPGRPKTEKIDAVWLAKLAERSMVTPSFVPAEAMRHVRDLARARSDLVGDRTRVKQRVEKLLEDSLVKIGTVLADIHGVSGRAMIEALIAGERDPHVLAGLAKGRPGPGSSRRPTAGSTTITPAWPGCSWTSQTTSPGASPRSPHC